MKEAEPTVLAKLGVMNMVFRHYAWRSQGSQTLASFRILVVDASHDQDASSVSKIILCAQILQKLIKASCAISGQRLDGHESVWTLASGIRLLGLDQRWQRSRTSDRR